MIFDTKKSIPLSLWLLVNRFPRKDVMSKLFCRLVFSDPATDRSFRSKRYLFLLLDIGFLAAKIDGKTFGL